VRRFHREPDGPAADDPVDDVSTAIGPLQRQDEIDRLIAG